MELSITKRQQAPSSLISEAARANSSGVTWNGSWEMGCWSLMGQPSRVMVARLAQTESGSDQKSLFEVTQGGLAIGHRTAAGVPPGLQRIHHVGQLLEAERLAQRPHAGGGLAVAAQR